MTPARLAEIRARFLKRAQSTSLFGAEKLDVLMACELLEAHDNAHAAAMESAEALDAAVSENVAKIKRLEDGMESAVCMLVEGPDAIGGLESRLQAIKILRKARGLK